MCLQGLLLPRLECLHCKLVANYRYHAMTCHAATQGIGIHSSIEYCITNSVTPHSSLQWENVHTPSFFSRTPNDACDIASRFLFSNTCLRKLTTHVSMDGNAVVYIVAYNLMLSSFYVWDGPPVRNPLPKSSIRIVTYRLLGTNSDYISSDKIPGRTLSSVGGGGAMVLPHGTRLCRSRLLQ